MPIETEKKRIEGKSGEAYIVMATMTTCSAIICLSGFVPPELVGAAAGVIVCGIIGMAIFGVMHVCSGMAVIWR